MNFPRRRRPFPNHDNHHHHHHHHHVPAVLEPYYSANIYRYKCVGHLKLSSKDIGSPGICRGLQFRTELVAKMLPGTREQSIKRFLDASSDYVDDDASAGGRGGGPGRATTSTSGGGGSIDHTDQQVKEIYTSRTLIYKDDDDDDDNNNNNNKGGSKKGRIHLPKKTLPEEELIDKTEWSCYGSTNVHYLVLKPERMNGTTTDPNHPFGVGGTGSSSSSSSNGASVAASTLNNPHATITFPTSTNASAGKIAALTPDNLGIALRKIDSQVGHFTMIDVGSIRVCLETPSSVVPDDDEEEDEYDYEEENVHPTPSATTTAATTTSATNTNTNTVRDPNELSSSIDKHRQYTKKKPKKKPPPPTIEEQATKIYDFSWKIVNQMKVNGQILKESVSDDFPSRTMFFGQKIVGRFQKTADQTMEFMGKIIDTWWKDA